MWRHAVAFSCSGGRGVGEKLQRVRVRVFLYPTIKFQGCVAGVQWLQVDKNLRTRLKEET